MPNNGIHCKKHQTAQPLTSLATQHYSGKYSTGLPIRWPNSGHTRHDSTLPLPTQPPGFPVQNRIHFFWPEIIFCHPIITTILQLSFQPSFQQSLSSAQNLKVTFRLISIRSSLSCWHICPLFLFLFLNLDPFGAGTIFTFSVFFTPKTL